MKLNLGSGFKKKSGFINVDNNAGCEPDRLLNLEKDVWPWAESSVQNVVFEYSLEQMGNGKNDLFHILKELYRVCDDKAVIEITATHPRHDQFVLNPLSSHALSPQFFQMLSVSANLQQIANGQSDTCLGLMLGVDFVITRVKFLISTQFQADIENGKISEEEIRTRMTFENNICQAIEIDLMVVKFKN